jgi:hypothetical protein
MSDRRPKKDASHVRTYKRQIQSAAWRDLSGSAVKVLLAMQTLEKGDNNGSICFSDRMGAEMAGLSRNTVQKSIKDLIDRGFIYCTEQGGFSRKTPHAAMYGFTWLAGPKGEHRAPSHAYEKWKPDGNTRAQFLTETGSVSKFEVETSTSIGANIEPEEMEIRQISDVSYLSEIEPQTVYQGIGAATPETDQRKHANSPSRPDRGFSLGDEVADLRHLTIQHISDHGAGSQSRLAVRIGCPPGTFSKFIGGRNLPAQYRAPLADALREKRDAA